MLCFKGKITQHVVPAAGLEPARPTKPRDFKTLVYIDNELFYPCSLTKTFMS